MNYGRDVKIIVSFADFGGAQLAALRLASGLRESGHDPQVIFLYAKKRIERPDHDYQVIVPTERPHIAAYFGMAWKLLRYLQRERPDQVLTFLPLAHVIGQTAAFLAWTRRRVVSHRTPVNTIGPIMRVLDMALAWAGIYTHVVAVSESVRGSCRHYPKWLRRRTVVVHNGLRNWRSSQLTHTAARKQFGVPERALALVAVGRIAKQKNYPLLLRVIERLDNVLLLIAGDGPLRNELQTSIARAGASDKVHLLGAVARDQVPDLLRAADIFVQTSIFEGQSNSVLEALQSGLPVIAHDIPEQRETIAESSGATAGALVPLNDVEAWVAAIETLRRDSAAAQAARESAVRRAEVFRFENMIAGFERVLYGDIDDYKLISGSV